MDDRSAGTSTPLEGKNDRFSRIEKIYYQALERSEEERPAFLAEACGGDSNLRREVEKLLSFDRKAGSFMESPALDVAARALAKKAGPGKKIDFVGQFLRRDSPHCPSIYSLGFSIWLRRLGTVVTVPHRAGHRRMVDPWRRAPMVTGAMIARLDRRADDSIRSPMLTAIKTLHTALYAVMVAAILHILYCGISGALNALLAVSVGVVALEGAVFFGNGRKCPLTALAQRYGDPKGYVGDIFLPEWLARRTFLIFTSLSVVGLLLVAVRFLAAL